MLFIYFKGSEELQRGVRDDVLEFAMWSKDNQLHLYAGWAWYMCRRKRKTPLEEYVPSGESHICSEQENEGTL